MSHATREGLGLGARPRTENLARVRHLPVVDYPADVVRPRTRGECVDGPRPCPWVSCRHHLAIETNGDRDRVKFVWPDRELEGMPDTCALDVADRGGASLETVGATMNITRERARQLFDEGLAHVQRRAKRGPLSDFAPEGAGEPRRCKVSERTHRVEFFGDEKAVDNDGSVVEAVDEYVDVPDREWCMRVGESAYRALEDRMIARGIIERRGKTHEDATEIVAEAEETMRKKGELSNAVAAAHERLSKLGRAPTYQEIFDDVGEQLGRNVKNVSVCAKRLGLTVTSARALGSAATPRPKPVEKPKAAKRAMATVNVTVRDDDPIVVQLRGEIARFERKAEALRAALEAFEAAS